MRGESDAENLGLKKERANIKPNHYNTLLSNHVSIIIKSTLFCKGENLPHWIVVNAMDSNFLYFSNPLHENPQKKKFKLSTLEKVIGYRGDQSMVEIWKQSYYSVIAFSSLKARKCYL
jgi:Peptidase_C39 like family